MCGPLFWGRRARPSSGWNSRCGTILTRAGRLGYFSPAERLVGWRSALHATQDLQDFPLAGTIAELSAAVEDAQAWRELETSRPPLCQSHNGSTGARFAKDLKRFAKKRAEGAFHSTVETRLASWDEKRAKD